MLRELCLKTLLIALFACILVLGNIVITFAQPETNTDLVIKLIPSIVEVGEKSHQIGYVGIVNPNGNLLRPTSDISLKLESSNPYVASVPPQITIPAGSEFAVFDIFTVESGSAKIFATLGDQSTFDTITVGEIHTSTENDLRLVINLPTSEMNVDSVMPFSLYLQDSEGQIAQAPFDISVVLDYETSLVEVESSQMTISKGNSYVWSTIKSKDKVGNAFLRATSDRLGIDEARQIRISSSLPSSLAVDIFPEKIPATLKRDIDVIVSLVDSDNLPTFAQEDVRLQFFSDDESIGSQIDRAIKESQLSGVIKKGDFSYRLSLKLDLTRADSEFTIGATTKGLGIASDTFRTVVPITTNNPQAANKTLQIFTLDKIPTKSEAITIIQIGALLNATDDQTDESDSDESVEEKEFHPLIINENYESSGSAQKINLISSNDLLMKIKEIGNIDVTSSYGTAIVQTGQETGQVVLSSTIKGIGSSSVVTEVINTLKQEQTIIFSPTGTDAMLFDKNGYFDLFLISLDTKNRPTVVENENRYLLTPINEIVTIEKNKTFSHVVFQGNLIQAEDQGEITVTAVPIGESADPGLETQDSFEKKPTAKLQTYIPFTTLNSDNSEYSGIVQILDFYGNPIVQTADLRVKLSPSELGAVQTPDSVVIPKGSSYAKFPIHTNGEVDLMTLIASSKGIVSNSQQFEVNFPITKLNISIGSINEPVPVDEPTELKIYVDDEYQNSVGGVTLRLLSDDSSVTPQTVTTSSDGSATIQLNAKQAPKMSLQIFASAEGYSEEQETFEFSVSGPVEEEKTFLPDWMIYAGIGAAVAIAGGIVFFLKKPKKQLEDEDELYE